jgi:hypothetical protein
MSKETMVSILGVLVFFSPFMGFPREYKEWFLIGAGILLSIIGYRLRRIAFLRSLDDGSGGKRTDVFTESSSTISEIQSTSKQDLHI